MELGLAMQSRGLGAGRWETRQPSFHFTVLRACGKSEDGAESTQQKPGSRGKKQEAAGVTISL